VFCVQLPNKLVYWRALLQQLLSDSLGFVCNEWRVGKISPKGLNFSSYARKALIKLGYASKVRGLIIIMICSYDQN